MLSQMLEMVDNEFGGYIPTTEISNQISHAYVLLKHEADMLQRAMTERELEKALENYNDCHTIKLSLRRAPQ